MPRLGSVLLAAVLLGVPRALEARAFGAQRSVYVEVAPLAAELREFAEALERALAGAAWSLATRPSEATLVIEVLAAARARSPEGRPVEAVSIAVRDACGAQPLLLHYDPGRRDCAARALLARLPASRPRAC